MNKKNKEFKSHLFICTNSSGCAFLGGQKLRDRVKSRLISALGIEAYKTYVRVNNSGCLGDCSQGIAACMYPQNLHWTDLKPEDEDYLVEHVLKEINDGARSDAVSVDSSRSK